MSDKIIQSVWPIVVVLAFLVVNSFVSILAAYMNAAISTHDLLRQSKMRRVEYLKAIAGRTAEIEED